VGRGWTYRIDYPYYSWAETFVRPRIIRRDLTALLRQLNEIEGNTGGQWKSDTSEMTSAVKFAGAGGVLGVSTVVPDVVARNLRAALVSEDAAVAVI